MSAAAARLPLPGDKLFAVVRAVEYSCVAALPLHAVDFASEASNFRFSTWASF